MTKPPPSNFSWSIDLCLLDLALCGSVLTSAKPQLSPAPFLLPNYAPQVWLAAFVLLVHMCVSPCSASKMHPFTDSGTTHFFNAIAPACGLGFLHQHILLCASQVAMPQIAHTKICTAATKPGQCLLERLLVLHLQGVYDLELDLTAVAGQQTLLYCSNFTVTVSSSAICIRT